MNDIIEIKLIPIKDLYPYTSTDFRVYSCIALENDAPVKLNSYGNFTISGEMQELILDTKYIAKLQEQRHPKYGVGYKVISIRQDIPTTIEGQYAFLKTIIPERYVNAIKDAYPNENNIIQLIREERLDYSKIKGIGDVVFKRILNAVNENFDIQDALIELSELGVTHTMIKKIIDHFGGNVQYALQKIKENIYILCEEVSGIGFKKVDGYALRTGVKKDSPNRINACIEYILKKEEDNGHCWIELDDLIEKVMDETDLEYKVISDHLKSESFTRSGHFFISNNRIGLYKNYYYESKSAECLMNLLNHPIATKVNNLEEKIKKIEQEQGFPFTDEQISAIYTCVEKNVVIISGKAGSGKTTILKGVLGVLSEYTYITCSLSGKASQRIIEATGLQAKTIHRLLGYNPIDGFLYGHNNRLPYDIVVLDEASMVNSFIFYKLVSAIKDGGKLIILGDIKQLPPIGAGLIFLDLINSGIIPVCELTEVHRQAKKSGILLYANKVRDGIQINERNDYSNKTVGELQDLILIPFERKKNIAPHIINICERIKDRIDLQEFQVIVPMKERGNLSTKALNNELQKVFNPNESEGLKRNGYEYRVGDKIIKKGNDYYHDVFNGTIGFIEWIDLEKKEAGFSFVGKNEIVIYSQEEMKDIDMAYALTVHSCQGSQFENVIFAFDYSAYKLLSLQLVYTGLTRASKKCMFLFENEALRYAISNDEVIQRNTYLKDILEELKNKI